jgi:hypothetical protein
MNKKERISAGEKWYEFIKDNDSSVLGSLIIDYVESLRGVKQNVVLDNAVLSEGDFIDLCLKTKIDEKFEPKGVHSVFYLQWNLCVCYPPFKKARFGAAKSIALEFYYDALVLENSNNN